jgi:peptide/nickel transport system substrate-binding protein
VKRKLVLAAVALAVGAMTAACGGSNTPNASTTPTKSSSAGAQGGGGGGGGGGGNSTGNSNAANVSLTIVNVAGQMWTCGFNPFNPSVNGESIGFVYEPLVYVNTLQNSKETPMLAKSYTWAKDKKTLTFTVRSNVKWSDGKPFTAADVAFTFNLMKKYPALDLNALWSSVLSSVKASGDKVTMTFSSPALPYFYYIADQTPIVPEHVWSTGAAGKNPVQYRDTNPIGTGPYTVNPCRANNITYKANPNYWQPGLPKIGTLQYPAYTDNGPANLDLANDKGQWGGQFIPSIQKFFVEKDPTNHHYWYPPVSNVSMFFNLKHSITGNLNVRKAFAFGIDRDAVGKIGEGGYQPGANQTGVVLPTFAKWYNKTAADKYGYKHDEAKAKMYLKKAGYSPSHPLKLDVITVTGFTDWDASLQEIKQELQPIGIDLNVKDLSGQTYDTKLYSGDYDLAYASENGGPSPYYELRQMLYGPNSAPLGKNASSNYERYMNPATDKLFNEFASANPARQVAIIKQIQNVMLSQVPVVPVTESVSWFQYNTQHFDGWPTAKDPYALPAPYAVPDNEQVLLHLQPK